MAKLEKASKQQNEAKAEADQALTNARAVADRYNVTYTVLDKPEDIFVKVKKAKDAGVIPEGETSEEHSEREIKTKRALVSKTLKKTEDEMVDKEITSPEELTALQDAGKLHGFSGWSVEKKDKEGNIIKVPSMNDKTNVYEWVKGAKAVCRIIPAIILGFLFLFGQSPAYAEVAATDEGVLGKDRWSIQNDGDFVPGADSDYDIGASGAEVNRMFVDNITLGGVNYTSLATGTDGNWTNGGLDTTLDAAPTKFIATHSSGDFASTTLTPSGLTASKVVVSGAGKTLASSTVTTTELGYLASVTTPTGTGALVLATTPTLVTPEIGAATGTSLVLSGALSASTTVTATTGITSSSTITLQNSETIKNATDGTVQVASNATAATLEVYAAGTANEDATLLLRADASADNGDDWQIVSDGATNSLFLQNDTSGAQATILTLSNVGLLTTTGDVLVAGTTPLVTIGDAGEEDTAVKFDGNAQDFSFGLDDSADKLVVSLGGTLGTTNRMAFNSADLNIVLGDASAADVAFIVDGNAIDFSYGIDDSADTFSLSVGSTLGTTEVFKADGTTITFTDIVVNSAAVTNNGATILDGSVDIGSVTTFTDSDATPDVTGSAYWNTNTTGVTITDFDGAGLADGQIITIISKGAITYDVTASGLVGGTTDLVTANTDLTQWIYNGTDWYLIQFTDQSDNLA